MVYEIKPMFEIMQASKNKFGIKVDCNVLYFMIHYIMEENYWNLDFKKKINHIDTAFAAIRCISKHFCPRVKMSFYI